MRPLTRSLLIATACLALPAGSQAATPFTAGSGAEPERRGRIGRDRPRRLDDRRGEHPGRLLPRQRRGRRLQPHRATQLPGLRGSAGRRQGARLHPRSGKGRDRRRLLELPDRDPEPDLPLDLDQQRRQLRAGVEIGTGPETNGEGTWLDDVSIFVGPSAASVKAALVDGEPGVQFATGGLFVYGPEVVRLSGTNKLVAASNDLSVIKYGVFKGASLTAAGINNVSNWEVDKTLTAAEPENTDSSLNSGPNGVYLTYRNFIAGDNHLALRHFDPATNTFGPSTFIEGGDPIENSQPRRPRQLPGPLRPDPRGLDDPLRRRSPPLLGERDLGRRLHRRRDAREVGSLLRTRARGRRRRPRLRDLDAGDRRRDQGRPLDPEPESGLRSDSETTPPRPPPAVRHRQPHPPPRPERPLQVQHPPTRARRS